MGGTWQPLFGAPISDFREQVAFELVLGWMIVYKSMA
jgi:hypothetical protein